jgi:hypothetical protein
MGPAWRKAGVQGVALAHLDLLLPVRRTRVPPQGEQLQSKQA